MNHIRINLFLTISNVFKMPTCISPGFDYTYIFCAKVHNFKWNRSRSMQNAENTTTRGVHRPVDCRLHELI